MAQIVGYLTEKEALRFLDYAQACGVTGSTLANLLISRELRLGRLSVLAEAFEAQRSLPNSAKIVAHLTDPDRKTEFYAHAARHGLKPAAAKLVRSLPVVGGPLSAKPVSNKYR